MKELLLTVSSDAGWAEWNIMNFEGVFDATSACVLRERLLQEEEGPTVIDLTHATVRDSALEILADLIKNSDPRPRVRGLGHHHEVILRYLGVPLSAFLGVSTAPVPALV